MQVVNASHGNPSHYCVHEKGMTRLQWVCRYQMAQGQGNGK